MNPRIAEAHPAPLMPFPANTRLSDRQAVYLEARRARDAMVAAALRDLYAATVGRLVAWNDRRRALAELRSLTDRELADIGLNRGTLAMALRPHRAGRPERVASLPVAANDRLTARAAA